MYQREASGAPHWIGGHEIRAVAKQEDSREPCAPLLVATLGARRLQAGQTLIANVTARGLAESPMTRGCRDPSTASLRAPCPLRIMEIIPHCLAKTGAPYPEK